MAFSSFSHHNRNQRLPCHSKTCGLRLPPVFWLTVVRGGCAERSRWMGSDVLLLGYISIKRGGAQHAVVHADRAACVWWISAWGTRTGVFEKQGRARLWQVAAAGWLWWLGGREGGGDCAGDVFGSRKVYKESMFIAHKDWWMVVLGPSPCWVDWTDLEDDITTVLLLPAHSCLPLLLSIVWLRCSHSVFIPFELISLFLNWSSK